ncbi:hypothetical protein [Bradyrhizobium canariense]|uniref:hypothetical protein n=1 Tax=Bradyrhizobium canariense TaxID=255045 RepID=UPI0011785A71|nr:hypothetical protein [Bradyrhizobium canariense]
MVAYTADAARLSRADLSRPSYHFLPFHLAICCHAPGARTAQKLRQRRTEGSACLSLYSHGRNKENLRCATTSASAALIAPEAQLLLSAMVSFVVVADGLDLSTFAYMHLVITCHPAPRARMRVLVPALRHRRREAALPSLIFRMSSALANLTFLDSGVIALNGKPLISFHELILPHPSQCRTGRFHLL